MTPDVFAQESHALIVEAEMLCAGAVEWGRDSNPYLDPLPRARWYLRMLQAHPSTAARQEP